MDAVGDLALLASPSPTDRFAAEDRIRASGAEGVRALERLLAVEGVPDELRDRARDLHGSILSGAAVEAFRTAVPDPMSPELWPAAVSIAAEAALDLDTGRVERGLKALVEGARAAVPSSGTVAERVVRLTAWLFHDQGFRGGDTGFRDPRDSYLPDVLERRTGLPVALAVLWMTLASRLGLAAAGVGLPLHFVARCEGDEGPVFVDAFHGEVLDEEGCRRLVAKAAGREVALPARAFRPLRTTEILARMMKNLRLIHEQAGRPYMALASVDRSLHLQPLDGAALRDRAVLLARLSRPAAAARTIVRVLALFEPEAADREHWDSLRRRLARAAAERN